MVTNILDVWVTNQAWGHDGWILAKFFLCVFMDRSINTQKENLVLAGQSLYPERARQLHLARSGNQSQREIRFILPAHGPM